MLLSFWFDTAQKTKTWRLCKISKFQIIGTRLNCPQFSGDVNLQLPEVRQFGIAELAPDMLCFRNMTYLKCQLEIANVITFRDTVCISCHCHKGMDHFV